MDTDGWVLWSCALANTVFACALMVHFRRRVNAHLVSERGAKAAYSWLCVGVYLLSGIALFFGVIELFHVPVGHGEILIAGPLLNLALSAVLLVVGRIVIGWEPMHW